ncbi:MAG: hypothetical protein ACR2IZ_01175 [Candidatus Nanopelagicus sp.]
MAKIIDQGQMLELQLSKLEKIASLHKNIIMNKSNLISREIVKNPWRSGLLKGFRAPGTGIPFYLLLGTMRYRGGKDFTIIYKNKPVEVLEFKDAPFKRWIVTVQENH